MNRVCTHFFCKVITGISVVALLGLVALPVFSQTAEVKRVGVYYKDNPTTLEGMYCDLLSSKISKALLISALVGDHAGLVDTCERLVVAVLQKG